MPSTVTDIISSTVVFLCVNALDSVAEKLKDGDLADEKLREIIVQGLTDIKSKHDSLSLKDLDSSYSFLKEGVRLLILALDKSNEDQKAGEDLVDEATRDVNDTASGILSTALSLSETIQRLKISSKKRFDTSKDRFKASRERATDAFNNKSLSIKDRIMACKLRVAAGILEIGLEDPVAATASCLLSVKELHGLPAVREMFSVFLKGGLKSKYKKAERLDIIMSVLSINHALFDFAVKFSSNYPNVFTWPGIELIDQQFNPIINGTAMLISRGESLQQLNRAVKELPMCDSDTVVNSRSEIVKSTVQWLVFINPNTGEQKLFTPPDTKGAYIRIKGFTFDSDNNVYVIVSSTELGNKLCKLLLYMIDGNYDMKHKCVLDVFGKNKDVRMDIAVDQNKNVVMIYEDESIVYVLDGTGKLKYKFECDGEGLRDLSITNANDIMVASRDQRIVRVYTTEGNLKSTINVPENYRVYKAAYHSGIGKIIARACYDRREVLQCYSEAGALEHTVDLGSQWNSTRMTSHPSGSFAVTCDSAVILI